jgi:hypothetical protein
MSDATRKIRQETFAASLSLRLTTFSTGSAKSGHRQLVPPVSSGWWLNGKQFLAKQRLPNRTKSNSLELIDIALREATVFGRLPLAYGLLPFTARIRKMYCVVQKLRLLPLLAVAAALLLGFLYRGCESDLCKLVAHDVLLFG